MRQTEGSALSVARPDTTLRNHTDSNQSERGRNRPSERGAVAGRRMSAVVGARSVAECVTTQREEREGWRESAKTERERTTK